MVFIPLHVVAVIEAERRHDRVAHRQLIHLICWNRKSIRPLAGKHLAGEILAALIIARLGLGGTAGGDADTAPVLAVIIPVVAGHLNGERCGGCGKGLLHNLKAVFFLCIADKVFPRGSSAAVIGHDQRQLFACSQPAQAVKCHELAHFGL